MTLKGDKSMTYVWSAVLFFLILFIVVRYVTGTKGNGEIKTWQKASFISGALLFLIAQTNPVLELGNSLFFVFMMQQTIIYFMVPPLIFLGLTDSILKPVYNHRILSVFLKFLTKPVVSLVLFNLLFSVFYFPFVFDTIMTNPLYRILTTIILLILSFIMWWPLLSPAKNNSTLKPLIKIVYIIGMGTMMTPLAAYIIFSTKILYRSYGDLPRSFDFPMLSDQQAGGVVMKVMQIIIYCIMIAYCYSEAVRLDRNQDEALTDKMTVDKT